MECELVNIGMVYTHPLDRDCKPDRVTFVRIPGIKVYTRLKSKEFTGHDNAPAHLTVGRRFADNHSYNTSIGK